MYCYELQPFITIRGLGSTVTSVTQSEYKWLDLGAFQDVVAWLDVKEFTLGGATNITLNYETAPNKENADFVAMNASGIVLSTSGPTVSIFLKDTATNALARWLRWTLNASGATGAWDATFRIWIAANAVGRRRPLPALWRGDVRPGRGPM